LWVQGISADLAGALPRFCDLIKSSLVGQASSLLAGESLPAPDRDIDIERIEFDAVTDTPAGLGCDQVVPLPRKGS
jgi:hypothetical protein